MNDKYNMYFIKGKNKPDDGISFIINLKSGDPVINLLFLNFIVFMQNPCFSSTLKTLKSLAFAQTKQPSPHPIANVSLLL